MGLCGPRPSSRRTATPTSTRSRRCWPRAGSTRGRSPAWPARSTATCASSTACTPTSSSSSRPRGSSSTRSARLIVVETTHAGRLGELEPVALDPDVEKVVFDHHAGEPPDWASREHRPLRGRRAHDDAGRHPRRAGDRRDAARGDRLRARHPRGHGLAHLPDGDAARRRGARLVPAPRRAPGAARRVPAHAADGGGARAARRAPRRRVEPHELAGVEVLVAAVAWPRLRRRRLQPRPQGRRPDRLQGARAARRDGRARVLRRRAAARRSSTRPRSRGSSAAAGIRRRPRRSTAARSPRRAARARPTAAEGRPRAAHAPRRDVEPGAHRRARRDRRAGARRLPAPRPERDPRRPRTTGSSASSAARTSTARSRTGSRTRRSRAS